MKQGPRTEKHHRFRIFHRCNCVGCTVERFAKAQRQIQDAIRKAA